MLPPFTFVMDSDVTILLPRDCFREFVLLLNRQQQSRLTQHCY